MRKYHNQFAKQICNITVKKPPSKINQKLAKQIAKNSHYSQHQPRIHTEPSPKNSFSKEQYEGFQSFLEINQIEETEEDENININLDSKDLQHKLSVSFYAKEERRKSQFEPIESCNPIYQPLMCKQKPVAHLEFQQFMTNSNQEYYLLNNASNQLLKTSSVKASKNSNQLTSATTTLGKSSHQNISVSKFEKNPGQDAQAVVKPYPLADKALQKQILDLMYHAKDFKQVKYQYQISIAFKVKKGCNEVIKTLRRGVSQFVIMAADTKPLEMLMIVPQLCEEKDVPYCFIEFQAALGRACGSRRPAIAATITSDEGSQLNGEIEVMRDLIQQLFI